MKEFNCKVSSTWSVYGREREKFLHAQALEPRKERGDIGSRNYVIGPMRRYDEKYIHNDGREHWQTWNLYPFMQRIQEEAQTNKFTKGETKKWTGWKPKDR